MNEQLRKDIIGHIEASGELACWIVPYLYHAAYQAVKELERDGVIIVEVGKRGEPVYVFTPSAAPPTLPADAGEQEHCPRCGRPLRWLDGLKLWVMICDDFDGCGWDQTQDKLPPPAPVRLTVSQYKALDILSKVDVAYIGNSSHLMPSLAEDGTFWGKVYANTAKVLLTQGLAKRVGLTSIAITDLGRAALTANGARHD